MITHPVGPQVGPIAYMLTKPRIITNESSFYGVGNDYDLW